jgi:N6-L-threonylcarbamoyladenine synthase
MSQSSTKGLILGIETSCDETAAAVVREGERPLSNIVASQIALHTNYGGVVPELASREHLRNIVPVVREAIRAAGIAYADLDAIAVTEGPGLAGALLVGITFAKSLAFGLDIPLIAVNHLEGHIHAVMMEQRTTEQGTGPREQGPSFVTPAPPLFVIPEGNLLLVPPQEVQGPTLALVVSGGHTHLYLATHDQATWTYRNVGRTVDDAAGEAYDKVAKLLGLGYPGGPWMDTLSAHGDPKAVPFHFGHITSRAYKPGTAPVNKKAPAERTGPVFDFSFSGIKTAVLRYVETHVMKPAIETRRAALAAAPETTASEAVALCNQQTLDLIASFQHAVVGNLMRQSFAAAEAFGARSILVSGGVAANRELRRRFTAEADRRGLTVAFPSIALSTDNAAMIAAAAWPKFLASNFADDTLVATPQLKLG